MGSNEIITTYYFPGQLADGLVAVRGQACIPLQRDNKLELSKCLNDA